MANHKIKAILTQMPKSCSLPHFLSHQPDNITILISDSAKNFCVIFDNTLSSHQLVFNIAKSYYYHLYICQIQKHFPTCYR